MRTSISAPAGGVRFVASFFEAAAIRSRSRRAHWLLPDLAFLAAAVVLFYSLFLLAGYSAFFHDSDAGWHIRTGERILRTHSLPRTDPFSFTAAHQTWFAWEWLADIAVGTIHQFAGLAGVAAFYSTVLSFAVWLWFQLNWRAEGSFLLAALFAAPMLSTTNLHWLARPHLLSWIFLLLTLTFATRPNFTRRSYAAIAALSCLWANVHASFLLGPAILALYAAGSALEPLLFRSADLRPVPLTSRSRLFLSVAALSLAATFLNPYGWTLHQHVLSYLTDTALLDRVGEFQSFNFHLAGSTQILLTLALAATGAVLSLSQQRLSEALLIAVLLAMSLRSARGLPLVALLALPLANGAITAALQSAQNLTGSVRRFLDRALAYSARLRLIDRQCSGLIWAPALLLLAALALRSPAIAAHTGFPPAQFPVAASETVASLPVNARLFAPDKFGGYLIYRFAGTRKVFFDGRSDLYGAPFLATYGDLTALRPGWQQTLDRYRITHALLPANAPLIEALTARGWTPLYHDRIATLLKRN